MISGWGLNENGKKFSKRDLEAKKPGEYNKYDPEHVIDKYGADALRFWAAGSHLGQDLRYHEEDVKVGRKLVLKLWNIARLVEQYAPDFDPRDIVTISARTPEDRWIVHRLHRLLPAVERGFETYDYAIAREALDHFFWAEFADDYVELVKDRFWTEESYTDAQRASARSTLWETLRALLALYAPFLPYITEELYQYMYAAHEGTPSIHVTAWPQAPEVPVEEVPEIETVRAVLRTVRSERTRLGLPQGRPLRELIIDADDDETKNTLGAMTQSLMAAARARDINFGSASTSTSLPGVRIDIVPEPKQEQRQEP
jgi:valyl-tRNA synthetase